MGCRLWGRTESDTTEATWQDGSYDVLPVSVQMVLLEWRRMGVLVKSLLKALQFPGLWSCFLPHSCVRCPQLRCVCGW